MKWRNLRQIGLDRARWWPDLAQNAVDCFEEDWIENSTKFGVTIAIFNWNQVSPEFENLNCAKIYIHTCEIWDIFWHNHLFSKLFDDWITGVSDHLKRSVWGTFSWVQTDHQEGLLVQNWHWLYVIILSNAISKALTTMRVIEWKLTGGKDPLNGFHCKMMTAQAAENISTLWRDQHLERIISVSEKSWIVKMVKPWTY